jgi:hypothetical protein
MIEEHHEEFEEKFTDKQWNALETKQDDTRCSCLFYRHEILSVAAGQWNAIVSVPFSFSLSRVSWFLQIPEREDCFSLIAWFPAAPQHFNHVFVGPNRIRNRSLIS